MSPRAAWRLESIGFTRAYDYVAGKADWGSFGLPLEGTKGARAGEHVRADVPTCRLEERLQDVRRVVSAAGWDTCILVNESGVVLGRLGQGTRLGGGGRGRSGDDGRPEHRAAEHHAQRNRRADAEPKADERAGDALRREAGRCPASRRRRGGPGCGGPGACGVAVSARAGRPA